MQVLLNSPYPGFDRAIHDVDSTWHEILETAVVYDSVPRNAPRILLSNCARTMRPHQT